MTLNNLLAAPGFASWLEGEPLDVGRLLYTADGQPRVSIFSIAHLSDAERMFFVSLLLSQILGLDADASSGTTSLRAILYMDEIFGYFPPVANPPSKGPLLTLLKQARAFGLGVVLATQNPVDLDYKALSNTGTWFLGRLQTERDKARVLDGLEGAAAGPAGGADFDRGTMEQLLAGLGKRVFLLHNVHEDAPVVFETRWALSYLAGPLTRLQIARLTEERKRRRGRAGRRRRRPPRPRAPANHRRHRPQPVPPPRRARRLHRPPRGRSCRPGSTSASSLSAAARRPGWSTVPVSSAWLASTSPTTSGGWTRPTRWSSSPVRRVLDRDRLVRRRRPRPRSRRPRGGARRSRHRLRPPARRRRRPQALPGWEKDLGDALYRTKKLDLFACAALNAVSKPGESERDFRIRLAESAREERDRRTAALRQKYAKQAATFEERKRRAEQKVAVQREQSQQQKLQTAVSFGATLLGAFLGRKSFSAGTLGRASTAVRGVSRSMKEAQDVARAREDLAAVQQSLADLDAQLKVELDALAASYDPTAIALEPLAVKPRRSDVDVRKVALAWAPYRPGAGGAPEPAWG